MKTETKINQKSVRDAAETKLEKAVAAWVCQRMPDYSGDAAGPFKDLFHSGCWSGIVGHLIYTVDCVKFYHKHAEDIWDLAGEQAGENCSKEANVFSFLAQVNNCSLIQPPTGVDQIYNFLAWYGFEEAARKLAYRLELDV
jgi:hypothetical protein